ncbi:MAG: UDP-N-acetylmuramate--L-alanine ligase [Planctomycetes bacterium]|nr:UDP-N-acetylmuramate--L-alanine ligase [Planctomycetota bacterium]MCB9829793.1 UDP-N-acetylmuramate--L-alanine ligase [Planctomycetota bacterium]MCB9902610.1 UDP-N-acetylmuramate--L-alanine ligase [Planctomycetota bacterium]
MPAHPAPRADDLASVLATVRSAYLLGIGGVGMSGAARLLAARGIEVRGSDADPGGAAARLAGVPLEVTGEATVLPDGVDLVVRSAAIGPGHPQRAAAEERGLRMWRYADLVGALMADRVGIAVAGCHGKTTTSSLVASALAHAGTDPSWLVGGTLRAFGGGARAGAGPHFVVESCEFDRSFHAHRPHVAIVTNVDEDHLDYYADLAEIQESFRVFAALLPSDGQLVVNDAHAAVFRGDARLRAPLVTYGFGDDAAWRVGEPELTGDGRGVAFSLTGPDGRTTCATVPMLGRHNALNAAGAIATLVAAGVDRDAAEAGVAAFGGVGRRLELVAERRGVLVYDDYGHHPAEIRAVVRALRQRHPQRPLRVLFQPHQASRTRCLMREFASVLAEADSVWMPPIYFSRDSEEARRSVKSGDLVRHVRNEGGVAEEVESLDELVDFALERVAPGDVVITMGAGNIDEVARGLAARL